MVQFILVSDQSGKVENTRVAIRDICYIKNTLNCDERKLDFEHSECYLTLIRKTYATTMRFPPL